jgi:hypothetical protein
MSRQPRSTAAATRQLERYAKLEAQLAAFENARANNIAVVNAVADEAIAPIAAERDRLKASLEGWFDEAGRALLPKGRKSMELGGCMVGSRASRSSLTIAGDEHDVVAVLQGLRWAKPLLRVKTTLNRSAVLSSLDGKHQVALAELGIGRSEAQETFFVERAEQAGTIGS